MPTSATCSKFVTAGVLIAWANMTFAHALGHHDRTHSDSADQHVERSLQGPTETHPSEVHHPEAHRQGPASDGHEPAESSTARWEVDELISLYSQTGNDQLIEQGWKAIESDLVNPTPATWLHAAWLAQAEHRFDLARSYLAGVLKAQPRNPQAWLLEASIAMVQADYPAAKEACARVTLMLSPVVVLACKLRAEQQPGRRAALLERVSQLPLDELDDGVAAWVQSAIGDAHFLEGDFGKALMSHTSALALSHSIQGRAALADTLIELERYSAAAALLRDYRVVPALGVRYLLAVTRAGHQPMDEVKRLDTRFRAWIEQEDYRHAREMALFYLDIAHDPELAYQLALENVRYQKEFEDTAILERAKSVLERAHAVGESGGF